LLEDGIPANGEPRLSLIAEADEVIEWIWAIAATHKAAVAPERTLLAAR
jgi:hypothetical protein